MFAQAFRGGPVIVDSRNQQSFRKTNVTLNRLVWFRPVHSYYLTPALSLSPVFMSRGAPFHAYLLRCWRHSEIAL